jgi:hypothetical protein
LGSLKTVTEEEEFFHGHKGRSCKLAKWVCTKVRNGLRLKQTQTISVWIYLIHYHSNHKTCDIVFKIRNKKKHKKSTKQVIINHKKCKIIKSQLIAKYGVFQISDYKILWLFNLFSLFWEQQRSLKSWSQLWKTEKPKKTCFGHGSRTGPHQSEIRLLTHWHKWSNEKSKINCQFKLFIAHNKEYITLSVLVIQSPSIAYWDRI